MENPLLTMSGLPPFSKIKAEHVEPAIDEIIKDSQDQLTTLLTNTTVHNWNTLLDPLEKINDRIERIWSPISHLNAVLDHEELRTAYNQSLPKLSKFQTEVSQNETLYQAIEQIKKSNEFAELDFAQKKVINNFLRDFKLSGVDLTKSKKEELKNIKQELVSLQTKFSENVLDAGAAWSKHITDMSDLTGLPDSALALCAQLAEQRELDGYLVTLDFPSYFAIMTYADSQSLRQEVYQAFVTRASDQGPHAKQWNNSSVIESIILLRQKAAKLLGFSTYAERSLATKMAENPNQVLEFLDDLAQRTQPLARKEYQELAEFAKSSAAIKQLNAWDIMYVSEKLKQEKYQISQEELKPYFPLPKVITGLFEIINRLYGYHISVSNQAETWHKDVSFYDIHNNKNELIGQFYMDLHARENKRDGAWMANCITRSNFNGRVNTPVAFINCNFTPAIGEQTALLTHNEVTTLFHECGHGLHHLLTKVDYPSVAGISGVSWDAVELPSQFMENWCWEKEGLDLIASHYETDEPLPTELYNKMIAAKNFQSAMFTVRQLEFSLFDFKLHCDPNINSIEQVQALLDQVREQVAVVTPPAYNRFQHGFSHIFAGGYAAGYYSYKWAEVLSADAFSLFEEKGIFDRNTGLNFLSNVLEKGGSEDAMDLFIAFRGRKPEIDALLRHSGLS